MAAGPPVWTVGHGARPVEALIAVLHEPGIGRLVDIRRFPGSRRHPQFGRAPLSRALAAAGIGYEWAGEALGGRRSRSAGSRHTGLRSAAFAGYADHMDTGEFRAAVDTLLGSAGHIRMAIMCAETLWWHCHRMLVADALVLRGATVTHLLDAGRREPHRLTQAARPGPDGWPVYDASDPLPGL